MALFKKKQKNFPDVFFREGKVSSAIWFNQKNGIVSPAGWRISTSKGFNPLSLNSLCDVANVLGDTCMVMAHRSDQRESVKALELGVALTEAVESVWLGVPAVSRNHHDA